MSAASNDPAPPVGAELIDRGWRQGVLFDAPWARFRWNEAPPLEGGSPLPGRDERPVKPDREELVLVTQDCDIRSRDEQYVEAMICKRDRKLAAKVGLNSTRWFVVDEEQTLIASAAYRLPIKKESILSITPRPWPGSPVRLIHFTEWLGRRYDRPAVPDTQRDAYVVPVLWALQKQEAEHPDRAAALTRAVHELRASIPTRQEPPFDIDLIVLVKDDVDPAGADAIGMVEDLVRAELDPALVDLQEVKVRNEDEFSLRQSRLSYVLYLDDFTYEGDEVHGAQPLHRTWIEPTSA